MIRQRNIEFSSSNPSEGVRKLKKYCNSYIAMIYFLIKLHRRKMMGYISKVQVIQRGQKNRQYYFICPAPLAQALEIQKGEEIEWVVEDKQRLTIKRISMKAGKTGRQSHAK